MVLPDFFYQSWCACFVGQPAFGAKAANSLMKRFVSALLGLSQLNRLHPAFFSDGNGPRCQFPADLTLIPENAAADSWLSSSINFCLGNTTCQSMTSLPPPAWKIVAYIDRKEELSRIRCVQHLTGS